MPRRLPPSALDFRLAARPEGDSMLVRLGGDIDMAATFKLEPEVDRLLAEGDVRRLVLDLGDVRFIDSAGLGALLSIRERTKSLEIGMRLTNVPHPVQRLLEVGGAHQAFEE